MTERKGIPTLYEGVLMRSRTEARWAALFDQIEWAWKYEPFDCLCWIPDFSISFPAGDILVEVKSTGEDFPSATHKIDKSGFVGPAMVLAQDITGQTAGRLLDQSGGHWSWCQMEFFRCLSCYSISVLAYDGSWACRACGEGDGNSHVGHVDLSSEWASAGNRVQWLP